MPVVRVDFTDVQEQGALPEGTYRAVIETVTRETSQRSGEPMLIFDYKVTDGSKYNGFTAREYLSMQPQALWRLKLRLSGIGYEVPDGVFSFDTDDIVGTPVKIQCAEPRKDNQNVLRSNIQAVVLDEGEGAEPQVETREAATEPTVAKRRPVGKTESPGEVAQPAKPRPGQRAGALNVDRL